MDRETLKNAAKAQIKGKIGILFVVSLIIGVISTLATLLLSLIPFVGSLASTIIVTPAFALSTVRIYLNLFSENRPSASDAFSGFNDFWTAFKVQFLVGFFTFMWSLLFIIPGLIKAFSYSQAMYIVAENPGMSALDAINSSKKMMNGRKMDLFVLGLSFIGWHILACFTLGILYIWLLPYTQATYANFYYAVKQEMNV